MKSNCAFFKTSTNRLTANNIEKLHVDEQNAIAFCFENVRKNISFFKLVDDITLSLNNNKIVSLLLENYYR